jgi:peptide/nickel transport system permease protein
MAATRTRRRIEVSLAVAAVAAVLLLAIFGPLASPEDPLSPTSELFGGLSAAHPLGTDYLGRDVLSRILSGAPASVFSALAISGIALVVGGTAGVLSVYLGRIFEWVSLRAIDTIISLPFLLVAVAACALLGNGIEQAMIVVGILISPLFFRVSRAVTLNVLNLPYIEVSELLGVPVWRTIMTHVWPKIIPALAVAFANSVGTGLVVVSSLTFLGIGITPPSPTWGGMLADDLTYLGQQPLAPIFPIVLIVATVWVFNFSADLLRDAVTARMHS